MRKGLPHHGKVSFAAWPSAHGNGSYAGFEMLQDMFQGKKGS
jgi:hypothetical protein